MFWAEKEFLVSFVLINIEEKGVRVVWFANVVVVLQLISWRRGAERASDLCAVQDKDRTQRFGKEKPE